MTKHPSHDGSITTTSLPSDPGALLEVTTNLHTHRPPNIVIIVETYKTQCYNCQRFGHIWIYSKEPQYDSRAGVAIAIRKAL